MFSFFSDLRFAARSLWRTPAFTAMVILTVALGIGFNSANFSIVHKLLVRPIELPEIDRLAMVQTKLARDPRFGPDGIAPRTWLDWQDQVRSFDGLSASQFFRCNLTGAGAPEQLIGYEVSPDFFPTLRVSAALGRTFAPDEIDGQNP